MKQLLNLKARIYRHYEKVPLLVLQRIYNQFFFYTPHWRQQLSHDYQLLNANAIHSDYHDTFQNTLTFSSVDDKFNNLSETKNLNQSGKPTRSNKEEKYEVYLCDYKYEGKTYSIDIVATSFEDANARRRALQHGKIIGVLKARIPVNESWYYSILRFWKRLFGKI